MTEPDATLIGVYIRIHSMSKTIRVSDEYHELIKAHKRDDETMEETLRRMTGGPDPRVLMEILGPSDEETAETMREAIERRRAGGRQRRRELRERLDG